MALINATAIPNATGYELDQSLRLNDDDSAYLSWTPASAGNRKTFTWSGWVKKGNLGTTKVLFACGTSGTTSTYDAFRLGNDGVLLFLGADASNSLLITNQLFRDSSAWYHLILAVDTTQSTASNRMKMYVNGVQVTSFATANYPSQNSDTNISSSIGHQLGARQSTGSVIEYLDGYLAEVNFIDGQALTPADFGETGDYGEWKPIKYSGTYGTNGFYLNFAGGGVMSATGGTITTDGDYKVHTFTSNGTFTPTVTGYTQSDVEYLVIAGGGGGGHSDGSNVRAGGGGGAGGYRTGFLGVTSSTGYSITVGAGGDGASGSHTNTSEAGENSVFSSITSTGGGGGKGHTESADTSTGGSGGGGSWGTSRTSGGSASPAGQGNAGGTGGDNHPNHGGGGGGGAGAAGSNANYSSGVGGNGGAGSASSITGSSVTRAGGGGGAGNSDKGVGGSGGGGNGQIGNAGAGASHGTANTGGGGGGASGGADYGGNGGSGIVILRYKFQ